jgi:glycerophosphoryl diester phosphodiesterase
MMRILLMSVDPYSQGSLMHSSTHLVAHRGNAFEFPENTLPALQSALELGASFIEFDVHLSADLVPVVMHDANLLRCAGVDQDALAMRASALANTSVGEPARFGNSFNHVRIPLLADLVLLLKHFPHAKAFVELKRTSLQRHGTELMVERAADVLRSVASQVIMISFHLPAVVWARQTMRVPVGWVVPEYNTQNAIKAEATLPDFLFCDVGKLPGGIRHLWRGPWQWAFYEITSSLQAERLKQLGVRHFETMQVRRMMSELSGGHSAAAGHDSVAVI